MTMEKKAFAERVLKSRVFEQAKAKASDTVNNPEKLRALINNAGDKAARRGPGVLGEVWDALGTCLRMLAAYAKGEYREIPWKSLVALVAALIYFIMPVDVIPDFILGFGFADDIALIAWTVKSIKGDIDRFAAWEVGAPPEGSTKPGEEAAAAPGSGTT